MARMLPALLVVATALAAGCGPRSAAVRTGPQLPSKPDGCAIEVYLDARPSRAYQVIGQVEASGTESFAELVPMLKVEACRLGADAILDVKHATGAGYSAIAGPQGGVGTSYANYHSLGLAVQFTQP